MSRRRAQVKWLHFNQNSSCLAVGTSEGYRIYTTDTFRKVYEKAVEGGVRIVSMLYQKSLLAIVKAGASQSPRMLTLYNTKDEKSVCDISFVDTVINVRMNTKCLVVVLDTCLKVFDLTKLAPKADLTTCSNPKGLCALSMNEEHPFLAYPASLAEGTGDVIVVDALGGRQVHVIRAHKTLLAALTLSTCGTKLATASTRGTVIRVFGLSVQGHSEAPLLYSLRRGTSPASVFSLAFSHDAALLACTSSNRTVHIWRCDPHAIMDNHSETPGTVSDTMRNMVSAERSWASFSNPATSNPTSNNVIVFSSDPSKLYLATSEGHMYIYSLNLASGECRKEAEYQVLGDA
eukprot:TRINITY_DN3366_c0_g3_i1.p1 TRINITY_DN3366_c0_g3~~TRINITY_DN3366_c0_g3_i1.p1  ORF type:complete len:347 (+),score=110.40 TRINITY_DN3366_c0_g3_i1:142-1182(+)